MANILILGAGVMGSALTVPACENHNTVVLVGTHLDRAIIESIKQNRYHPGLDETLPDSVIPLQTEELTRQHISDADVLILGVSSAGVSWAVSLLTKMNTPLKTLSLVTKGLESGDGERPLTYAHTLSDRLHRAGITTTDFVGIGGPCIAREIVIRQPTTVVYAAENTAARDEFAANMQSPVYRVFRSEDIIGVEACAAIKNFLAIGVSTMIGRYKVQRNGRSVDSKNPVAAVFNQAVQEMALLTEWIGGQRETAFDHAGMGDLHVTVGGGRNSRLGINLGEGMTIQQAMDGPMLDQTVEGIDTGRVLAVSLYNAVEEGIFSSNQLPLTLSLLHAIETDGQFDFSVESLGQTL